MGKGLILGAVTLVLCTATMAGLFRYQMEVGQVGGLGTPFVLDRWTGAVRSCVPASATEFDHTADYLQRPHRWACGL